MSESGLPNTVNYQEQLQSLPKNTQCINIATAPSNGASFVSGNQIYFDIVNRGFLDPQSIYLSYTYTLAGGLSAEIIGTPVYQAFNRCEVSIGSVTIDQIQNYNLVMNTIINNTYDVGQKYGQQIGMGYFRSDAGQVPSLEQLDGHLCISATETGTFTAPLMNIFSSAEKMIPLFAMGAVRITLTMDAINNIFTSTVVPTGYTLTNMVLRYKVIDFGQDVEQAVRMSNPSGLTIKTQSFSSASTTLAANTTGYNELIYNMRYSSIKALIAVNGNGGAGSNKQFDSVDLTSGNGDYSFSVNGTIYPQKPLNTRTNKSEILQELRSAFGSIFDKNNNCSINSIEFSFNGTNAGSTYQTPAKTFVGTSLERLNHNSLLTGVSSADSPISYRINTGTSIGSNNSTVTLIVNYDALIIVDPNTKQTVIKE